MRLGKSRRRKVYAIVRVKRGITLSPLCKTVLKYFPLYTFSLKLIAPHPLLKRV